MVELSLEEVMKTTFKTFKERELLFRDLEEMGREKAIKRDELPETPKEEEEMIKADVNILKYSMR